MLDIEFFYGQLGKNPHAGFVAQQIGQNPHVGVIGISQII